MVIFRIKGDYEIDYLKPKTKYNQNSVSKEIMIKFRKKA